MLPVSGLYAALLTLLVVVLILRIVPLRHRLKIGMGDGGDPALARAIRAHANAIETIPVGVIMLISLELNHVSAFSLHLFGAMLLLSRCLHAVGLSRQSGYSYGRFWGTLMTILVLIAMAGANIWIYFS